MSNLIAPVALFVYRRRELTERTIRFLLANRLASSTPLVIFSDGPKPGEEEKVADVREYIHQISGFHSVEIHESPNNCGLANSIIAGVTQMCQRFDRVIVLEDDMETAPGFLEFMNNALNRFENDTQISAIHAYIVPSNFPKIRYFLRRGADCWGWAVWARSWKLFNPDASKLLNELQRKKLTKEFDVEGAFPFTKMLSDQAAGKIDSWAIRFRASIFLNGTYTLQSNVPLLRNIGFGIETDSTHCQSGKNVDFPLFTGSVLFDNYPIMETKQLREEYRKDLRRCNIKLWKRIYLKFKMLSELWK